MTNDVTVVPASAAGSPAIASATRQSAVVWAGFRPGLEDPLEDDGAHPVWGREWGPVAAEGESCKYTHLHDATGGCLFAGRALILLTPSRMPSSNLIYLIALPHPPVLERANAIGNLATATAGRQGGGSSAVVVGGSSGRGSSGDEDRAVEFVEAPLQRQRESASSSGSLEASFVKV
jgi:hypothetical protein